MRNVFVTSVESGSIEQQCVRMVESIRRHGGRRSQDPVIAVTPRFGPPLEASTLRIFERLDVVHLIRPSHHRYAWFHFLNKPLALCSAEQHVSAEQVTFIDCDTLIVSNPGDLLLGPQEDFTAAPSDEGVVGSTGPSCEHDADWTRICTLLGVPVDRLPWVSTYLEAMRIRLYWNAGIYAYRPATGFAGEYLSDCLKVLDANEGFARNGEHCIEQVVLGLTVMRLGMRWRHLAESHNFPVTRGMAARLEHTGFRDAAVIHYHECLDSPFYGRFLEALQSAHPSCGDWLAKLGPVQAARPPHWRLISEALRIWRGLARRRYRARNIRLHGSA